MRKVINGWAVGMKIYIQKSKRSEQRPKPPQFPVLEAVFLLPLSAVERPQLPQ
jgi:hypothetical protein